MVPGSNQVALRGGYGVFYQHINGEVTFQRISNQPWVDYRLSIENPVMTFANPFEFPGSYPPQFPLSRPTCLQVS